MDSFALKETMAFRGTFFSAFCATGELEACALCKFIHLSLILRRQTDVDSASIQVLWFMLLMHKLHNLYRKVRREFQQRRFTYGLLPFLPELWNGEHILCSQTGNNASSYIMSSKKKITKYFVARTGLEQVNLPPSYMPIMCIRIFFFSRYSLSTCV